MTNKTISQRNIVMKKILIFTACFLVMTLFVCCKTNSAENAKSIKLLAPQTKNGMPLMQALEDRRSMREFSSTELPLQVISDMLWAACGINRPESGHLTAPSAMNMQEIDIYVAKVDGLYLFDAKENMLMPVLSEDIRALTGKQPFVKDAPINLVYVADLSKMSRLSSEDMDFYAATDTGFISENVYLFCASSGLATVVRGLIDKPALAKAMKLRSDQKIILAQTVGYPKK
jgi:nitroreductase